MHLALVNGWKAQVKPQIPASGNPDDIIWTLYAVKDEEVLKVVWQGDRRIEATYFDGEQYREPRKIASVIAPKNPKIKETRDYDLVPFEVDAPALEVLLAVLGREVTWVRKIDGIRMSGIVEKETNLGKKFFRVYNCSSGRRILEWQDREGFHAAALDQIVNVS
jgi:hypothetical protein